MARISGVKVIKDSRGYPKQVIFDFKKHKEYLEDYLDHLTVLSLKDEETIPAEEVFRKLDKKHGY